MAWEIMRELTPKGKKIVRVAIVLVIVAVGLVTYWAIKSRQDPANTNTPAGLINEAPAGFTGRLPYTSDSFTIHYLANEDTFIVNIYEEPVEKAKTDALRYLERNGAKVPPSSISYFLGPGIGDHTGP
jgi:hypothetical protein